MRQLRRPWRPRCGCRCHRCCSSSRGRPRHDGLVLVRRRRTHGRPARSRRRRRRRCASAALGACSRSEGLALGLAKYLVLLVVSGAFFGRRGHKLPAGGTHGGRVGGEDTGSGTAPATQLGAGAVANGGGQAGPWGLSGCGGGVDETVPDGRRCPVLKHGRIRVSARLMAPRTGTPP